MNIITSIIFWFLPERHANLLSLRWLRKKLLPHVVKRGKIKERIATILLALRFSPELRFKIALMVLGIVTNPLLVYGALAGIRRSYRRLYKDKHEYPYLWPLPKPQKVTMVMGIIYAFLLTGFAQLLFGLFLIIKFAQTFFEYGELPGFQWFFVIAAGALKAYYAGISLTIISGFEFLWRQPQISFVNDLQKHGSADFATEEHRDILIDQAQGKSSIYIGGGLPYAPMGNITTVAGARGGKGANLIIPHLLGVTPFAGSMVIIDPKGENALITAGYQMKRGRKVRIINPWGLMTEEFKKRLGERFTFDNVNPLDLLNDSNNPNLADDADSLAQAIIPDEKGSNPFFLTTGRNLTGIFLTYLAVSDRHPLTLKELWRVLRLTSDEFDTLLEDMLNCDHPLHGKAIRGGAAQIASIKNGNAKEWGSILSTMHRFTNFFRPGPLGDSMENSDFDLNELSQGDTVLYVIIPADKLKSHSTWLRLMVTTSIRAVVKKPNKRVLFLLDEAYALGKLPEVEIGMGAYPGYSITFWNIFQSINQIKDLYGDNFENFFANSNVTHFFGLNDVAGCEYVSKLSGVKSEPSYTAGVVSGSTQRPLITLDEVRRGSDKKIFAFIDRMPVMKLNKMPYYEDPVINERADPNPYIKE